MLCRYFSGVNISAFFCTINYGLELKRRMQNKNILWYVADVYGFVFHSFFTRHCHWCSIIPAFPVSFMGQGHLDNFSSTIKKFYCTVFSCMALHTCVLFNYKHCFIKSWWNHFGPQRLPQFSLVGNTGVSYIFCQGYSPDNTRVLSERQCEIRPLRASSLPRD